MGLPQPAGTVTFVFTDLEGSTELLVALGDRAYQQLLAGHRQAIRTACARHGGYEVDNQGDSFFFAFASAEHAVAAVVEALNAEADGPLRVRVGIHTGEPSLDPPKYVGLDVHRAARVMAAAHGGQVLLSPSTRALLGSKIDARDLGEHRLKDFAAPQHLYQLRVDGLPHEFPPLRTVSRTNLPHPPSSFVGRERELADVQELLAGADRVVTLTGPGGSGKTRLALEVAGELVPAFAGGVFWVPLASLREPALVVDSIAQTLGAGDDLHDHIGARELLLLLDNFEQVATAAPALATLLHACPSVRLLVTSREPLRIAGEREYPVSPLEAGDGVELFCARANLDPSPAIAELCRRLDRLPLAIELAAARAKALAPEQLLERLGRRLDLLQGGRDIEPRQQTLRATVAWSYDLLEAPVQELFARVAVFADGFTLEAAEEICDADIDDLVSLVDRSLVNRSGKRYWLYETIRECAAERLAACGLEPELRARAAAWFLDLAEASELASRTGDRAHWFGRLEDEHDNLRDLLLRAHELPDPALEIRLVASLWRFWVDRGYVGEAARFLEAALDRSVDPSLSLLLGHCQVASMTSSSFTKALADADRLVAAAEAAGDEFVLVQALTLSGLTLTALGRHAAADETFDRALELTEDRFPAEEGELFGWWLINALWGPLPVAEGIERCRDARRRAPRNATVEAFSYVEQAPLEAMRGSFDEARRLLREGRAGLEALGLQVWAANSAQEGFLVEMLAEDFEAAVRDLVAARDRLAEMGERGFLSSIAAYLAHAQLGLGDVTGASRSADLAARLAAPDDHASQSFLASAQAKVAAREGRYDDAVDRARAAVQTMDATDAATRADRLADLAEVLETAGRAGEAADARQRALVFYEQKGNLVAAARVRNAGERAR